MIFHLNDRFCLVSAGSLLSDYVDRYIALSAVHELDANAVDGDLPQSVRICGQTTA